MLGDKKLHLKLKILCTLFLSAGTFPPCYPTQDAVSSASQCYPHVACRHSPTNCLLLQRSYDWNYNLNRHLKYECGKENAFMCSKCGRRFPHKQNCVYHLKRKHKIVCETIDQYVSAGLVVFQGSSVGSGTSETSPAGEQQQPGNGSNLKDQVASLQTKYEEMKDQHTSNGSGMKLESSVSPPPNSASS